MRAQGCEPAVAQWESAGQLRSGRELQHLSTLFPFEDLRHATIDRSPELVVSETIELIQAFVAGRVFDEDRGLMGVVEAVE